MLRGRSQFYSRRVQGRSEDTHVGRRKEHRIVRYRTAASACCATASSRGAHHADCICVGPTAPCSFGFIVAVLALLGAVTVVSPIYTSDGEQIRL
jgi:hypothetical protein